MIKNPLTIWFARFIKSKLLEYKNRDKFLEIGYMSSVTNCKFGMYNTIYNSVNLTEVILGDFTYIARDTDIIKTEIGKFCSIGYDCHIGLERHPVKNFVSTHPIFFSTLKQSQITFADKDYFEEFATTYIGNDVWIGARVKIVCGVSIGDGAIVAAGAVVTKNIPPYAITGGVPAKIIRYRLEKEEIEKLLQLKWWDKDTKYLKNNFKKFHNIREFLNDQNTMFR